MENYYEKLLKAQEKKAKICFFSSKKKPNNNNKTSIKYKAEPEVTDSREVNGWGDKNKNYWTHSHKKTNKKQEPKIWMQSWNTGLQNVKTLAREFFTWPISSKTEQWSERLDNNSFEKSLPDEVE